MTAGQSPIRPGAGVQTALRSQPLLSGRVMELAALGEAADAVRALFRWGRTGRRAAGFRGRGVRGLSLFGSLLAMALLGTVVLGVIVWLEERSLEDRARVAGTHLETLAHAVNSYVHSDFPGLLGRVGSGAVRISISPDLDDVLPAGFSDVDALGRTLQVMALSAPGNAVDVLVAQTLPAGDTLVPSAALLGERYGGVRMGLVAPEAPTRLLGPAIDEVVSRFQTAFSGVPATGALAVLERFDQESVCGSQLYRVANTGCPHAHTMATDLDMGGNDIVAAGLVEAQSLDVTEDIDLGGVLIVTGTLTVGQAVEVAGTVSVTGAMRSGSGEFTGLVKADTVEANTSMETGDLTATGRVMAVTVAASGDVNANGATMASLQSGTVAGRTVNATAVTAERVSVGSLQATGHMSVSKAGISRLIVGSCSGC